MGIPVNTHQRMAFDTVCPNSLILNRNDGVGERVMQVLSSYVFSSVGRHVLSSAGLHVFSSAGLHVFSSAGLHVFSSVGLS